MESLDLVLMSAWSLNLRELDAAFLRVAEFAAHQTGPSKPPKPIQKFRRAPLANASSTVATRCFSALLRLIGAVLMNRRNALHFAEFVKAIRVDATVDNHEPLMAFDIVEPANLEGVDDLVHSILLRLLYSDRDVNFFDHTYITRICGSRRWRLDKSFTNVPCLKLQPL